jgi:hypothetical protein
MGFAGQAFASSQVERCDGSSTDLAATGAVCCQVCLRCPPKIFDGVLGKGRSVSSPSRGQFRSTHQAARRVPRSDVPTTRQLGLLSLVDERIGDYASTENREFPGRRKTHWLSSERRLGGFHDLGMGIPRGLGNVDDNERDVILLSH